MAQQTINIGVAANDGSGDPFRTAFDKSNDNFTDLYTRVIALESGGITADSLFRSDAAESCNGAAGEVHTFSSQFVSVFTVILVDYDEIGIEITAQDQDGFTTTSLSSGSFGYVAIIEV